MKSKVMEMLEWFKNQPIYKRLFLINILFIFVAYTFMSQNMGLNADERYHVGSINKFVPYYTSFGSDSTFIKKSIDIFYTAPQFLNLTNYVLGKALMIEDEDSIEFFKLRHFYLSLFGLLIIIFASLIAYELSSWQGAFFTSILLMATPRLVGHSFMNPSDMPYAASYIVAVYFIMQFVKQLPVIKKGTIIGLVLSIGVAMGVRLIGGLIPIAYLLMFTFIALLLKWIAKERFEQKVYVKIMLWTGIAAVGGYMLGVLFWPFALKAPIDNVIKAFEMASKIPISLRQLFDGEHIRSTEFPWYYLLKYMGIASPIVMLLGLVFSLFYLFSVIRHKKNILNACILLFAFIFPLTYIIVTKANVYSGFRIVLFTYIPVIILSALSWNTIFDFFSNKIAKGIVVGVFILLCLLPLKFIAFNHPYEYTYFNELVGGLNKAYGRYETDYWNIAIKDVSEWLIENQAEQLTNGKTKIIYTVTTYPINVYLKKPLDGKIDAKYTRYYDRGKVDWDYGIFHPGYISGYQLRRKIWPPKGTIYTVKIGKAILAAVVKRENKSDYYGFEANKNRQFVQAIQYFQDAVKYDNNNESAWLGMAEAYVNIGDLDKGEQALRKSLQAYPDYLSALNMLGIVFLRKNQFDNAILTFDKVIKQQPGFSGAYANISIAYANKKNIDMAITYMQYAIQISPKYKEGYSYLANYYKSKGDNATAQKYLDAASKL